MILSSLCSYYDRKNKNEPNSIPPVGYEEKGISFVVVLDADGSVVTIEDWRIGEGRRKLGKPMFVPQGCDRTGKNAWKTAFFLWDHPRYVFGLPKDKKDKETAPKRIKAFKDRIRKCFPDPSIDTGINAVLRFYEISQNLETIKRHVLWPEIENTNSNVSFRLRNTIGLVCQSHPVVEAVIKEFAAKEEIGCGQCLITGNNEAIAKLHPATPVPGSKATAKLHSFNLDPFKSYGGEKGANAPISNTATFKYTTALNHLLSSRNKPTKRQCIHVGDAWTVFWADKPTGLETGIVNIFNEPTKDDPDRNVLAIERLYQSIKKGLLESDEGKARFFVLGLAPNAARIAVRFWHHSTVGETAARIKQHFDDLAITHADSEKRFLSLAAILSATANETKFDNNKTGLVYYKGKYYDVKPNLGGELMRAVLAGLPYPQSLLSAAVRRIRADHEITYPRTALIKACINRRTRYFQPAVKEELKMSLDKDNDTTAYALGRLFFILEEAQWVAHSSKNNPGANATIRDRFYGAASSTPATVFPTLLRLYPHHISKASKADRKWLALKLEKLVDEIINKLPSNNPFPTYLTIQDQGRFHVGYYHQRQDFFNK